MVILIVLLVLLLAGTGAALALLLARRPDPRAADDAHAAAIRALEAEFEARRAEDRAATAELLRSVVAEHGHTVEQAVQSVVAVASDKLAEKTAAGSEQLDLRQQSIDRQVEAVQGELTRVRSLVETLREQGAVQHSEMSRALVEAAERHQSLHATTDQLRQALASPQTRGQWGERMAEDVLRAAGMVEGINYRRQKALAGGTRPDITFFMPRGLLLNMDVKFPIDNYLRYLDADHPGDAAAARSAFVKDVRQRVKEITTRDYIDAETTAGCVLLFIPNESVYAFMHEHDPELADHALRQRVILCSPFTLFAVLAVIRQAMDQFLLERTSDEILRCLGGLTGEWQKFTVQLDKVGSAVERVHRAYGELNGTRRRVFQKRLDQIESIREQQGLAESAAVADGLTAAPDDAWAGSTADPPPATGALRALPVSDPRAPAPHAGRGDGADQEAIPFLLRQVVGR